MLPLALHVADLAAARPGGAEAPLSIAGTSRPLAEALDRLQRFAETDQPLLLTGESGTGKTTLARAAHLLSERRHGPFVAASCAQFADEPALLSALVGHQAGAFPGADADRVGLFEAADGGVLVLDEIADLPPRVQSVLLRAISDGEVLPLGALAPVRVSVCVIATTAQDPRDLAVRGDLRDALYYRLRRVHLPPLRERGDDWRGLATAYLDELNERHGGAKRFATGALDVLEGHPWPGNVRELRGAVDTAYCLTDGDEIGHDAVLAALDPGLWRSAAPPCRTARAYDRMARGEASFWRAVRDPYLDREMNRAEARAIVLRGLAEHGGSYKRALPAFGLGEEEYLRFMDFLRHHRLKPGRAAACPA